MKTPASKTFSRLPAYLQQYVTTQNYELYSARDQAVWRFILRQNRSYFREHAYSKYMHGLKKTGIPVHRIPRVAEMDSCLEEFGWGAVPVSGFIPPAAFLGFQAHRVLPIATQMRRMENIAYTPAPDIVHEAAGHAPILSDPGYRDYLASYAEVAKKAILNSEDLCLYEAIRGLSDIKEDPNGSADQIKQAEENLENAKNSVSKVSEATKMSRMAWWTTEYGLLQEEGALKIYGAGLLSSVGESQACFEPSVEKRSLDKACVEQGYDITDHQPLLYVANSITHLHEVLEDFSKDLAFRRGGDYGLRLAVDSKLPASFEYTDGIVLTGVLQKYANAGTELHLQGPLQISVGRKMIDCCKYKKLFFKRVPRTHDTGSFLDLGQGLYLNSEKDANGSGHQLLFVCDDPNQPVDSVYGGPQDRESFGTFDVGQASTQPGVRPPMTEREQAAQELYQKVRDKRSAVLNKGFSEDVSWLAALVAEVSEFPREWILTLELLELANWAKAKLPELDALKFITQNEMPEQDCALWALGLQTLSELDYPDQGLG
jgi:phenylalanine-4-hydroxylase